MRLLVLSVSVCTYPDWGSSYPQGLAGLLRVGYRASEGFGQVGHASHQISVGRSAEPVVVVVSEAEGAVPAQGCGLRGERHHVAVVADHRPRLAGRHLLHHGPEPVHRGRRSLGHHLSGEEEVNEGLLRHEDMSCVASL